MQIDTKIDPRWCEALLGLLEGDLSYSRVAEAKSMLRAGIDSIRKAKILDGSGGFVDKPAESNEQISPITDGGYSAWIIKAKELDPPIYLECREPDAWMWTGDINRVIKFCGRGYAEQYAKRDGARAQFLWEIVKHNFWSQDCSKIVIIRPGGGPENKSQEDNNATP